MYNSALFRLLHAGAGMTVWSKLCPLIVQHVTRILQTLSYRLSYMHKLILYEEVESLV